MFSGHNLKKSEIVELKNIVEDAILDDQFFLDELSITICPCSPTPFKIICIGLNYRKHASESGMAVPTVLVVFTKYNNTLIDYRNDEPLGKVEVNLIMKWNRELLSGKNVRMFFNLKQMKFLVCSN